MRIAAVYLWIFGLIYLLIYCFSDGSRLICSKNLIFIDFSYMLNVFAAAKTNIEAYFEWTFDDLDLLSTDSNAFESNLI